ncbi:MAG TPA: hypothetical protein VGK33_09360, partial [Chloroflexota bacterium]
RRVARSTAGLAALRARRALLPASLDNAFMLRATRPAHPIARFRLAMQRIVDAEGEHLASENAASAVARD